MKLFCNVCQELHQFTPGEVERIVYTLQGSRHDAVMTPLDSKIREYHKEYCLKSDLSMSYDGEGYSEHVYSLVESRRATQKEATNAA